MARFFIDRPIFAWVIAIVIMLAGAMSITQLPLEQYPDIASPTVKIAATYTGASAKTVPCNASATSSATNSNQSGSSIMSTLVRATIPP